MTTPGFLFLLRHANFPGGRNQRSLLPNSPETFPASQPAAVALNHSAHNMARFIYPSVAFAPQVLAMAHSLSPAPLGLLARCFTLSGVQLGIAAGAMCGGRRRQSGASQASCCLVVPRDLIPPAAVAPLFLAAGTLLWRTGLFACTRSQQGRGGRRDLCILGNLLLSVCIRPRGDPCVAVGGCLLGKPVVVICHAAVGSARMEQRIAL